MGKLNKNQLEFIRLMARGVTQSEAYKVSYGKKTVSNGYAAKQGSILAKKYASEIQQAKEKDLNDIEAAKQTEEAQEALKSIVGQAQSDAKAFRVLGENDLVDDCFVINGKPVPFKRKPTQAEIQKAYELYCKRFGSFQPVKSDVNISGGITLIEKETNPIDDPID